MSMLEDFHDLRRVGTPWVGICTTDYLRAIPNILEFLANADEVDLSKKNPEPQLIKAACWDCVSGAKTPILNSEGEPISEALVTQLGGENNDSDPLTILRNAQSMDENAVLFFVVPTLQLFDNGYIIQAISNLREVFKGRGCILAMIGPEMRLPILIAEDVPVLYDPLPANEELLGIVSTVIDSQNKALEKAELPVIELELEEIERAAGLCLGMTRFAVEEGVARKLHDTGIDFAGLTEMRRNVIETSSKKALKFETQPWTGRDMGGADAWWDYIGRIFKGPRRPQLIVRVDEIDKSVTAASTGTVADNTGVSQDLLRAFLLTLEDNDHMGVLFNGPPGCLHGNTPIFDPVDRTTKTVRERFMEARPFFVIAKDSNGDPVIAQAEPPHRYPVAEMLELTLAHGEQIVTTPAHKIWNGQDYVSLQQISQYLEQYVAYHLPTIADVDHVTLQLNARRSTQTAQGSRADCPLAVYSCGAPLPQALDTDQEFLQQQDGVLEHSRPSSQMDDSAGRYTSIPSGAFVLPSKPDCIDPAGLPIADAAEFRPRVIPLEHDLYCFAADEQLHPQMHQLRKEQSPLPSVPVSTDLQHPWPYQSSRYNSRGSNSFMVMKRVVSVKRLPPEPYYDFHVPIYNNYMACGMFHHNTGKTLASIATGNEFGCSVLAYDMGAVKGSLVGESEQNQRRVMQTILAMGDKNVLWIATCNRVDTLPPELQARFWLGTWFWDLPTEAEKKLIWGIQRVRYGIDEKDRQPDDQMWVGRDVRNCCRLAKYGRMSLKDASKFITVTGVVNAAEIERSRDTAQKRGYLSAAIAGAYKRPEQRPTARQIRN